MRIIAVVLALSAILPACIGLAPALRHPAVRTPQVVARRTYTLSEGLFGSPSTAQRPLRSTTVTEAEVGTETGIGATIRNAVAIAMRTLSKLLAFLAVLPFFKTATAEKETVIEEAAVIDEPMGMQSVVAEEKVVEPVNMEKIKATFQAKEFAPVTATVLKEPVPVVTEEKSIDAELSAAVALEPSATKNLSKPKQFKIPRGALRNVRGASTIEVRGPRPGKVYKLPRATYRKLGAPALSVAEATDKFLDGLLKWQDEKFGIYSGVDGSAYQPEFRRELAPGQRRTWLYFLGREAAETQAPMEAAGEIIEE